MNGNEIENSQNSIKTSYKEKCFPLKGIDKLTYELIESSADNTLYLRIAAYEGRGSFSKKWISSKIINTVLKNSEELKGKYLTGEFLNRNLKLSNRNTGGFLLAALKDLGAVQKEGSRYSFKTTLESALAERRKERESE